MTDEDWDDEDDAPAWFSPAAWPRWARIAFAVTLLTDIIECEWVAMIDAALGGK